ncbi:beta-eliminating lyase-related protein [Pararhizobium sp. YC-54]|uniref:threonine aldolase family protein n=1 Tax=Pararhizobium sp. YC-54 TaxID=2986920 RepID=UPI0021F74B7C|nr:beta-eliminating lyase-related protein [Pararhizobium sp. YC-54]MCV9999495.1 beta-eliminating lyase-related protein [Pararhizobium sp. YC-54]
MFQFNSDNGSPVCEPVMKALIACNEGVETAYGADQVTAQLKSAYSEFFEREVYIFPVASGTAGNGLALGAITPPYGTIFCHETSHIVTTEGGAPEFYSGGGRMRLLPGDHNKISPREFNEALQRHGIGNAHHMAASAISITQATEAGTLYQLDELAALSETAHRLGLKVHLDGARISNALVSMQSSPAEMTWKAGVDVVTFGTTKNGTMNAEAVIAFDPDLARVLGYMHKRAGHLFSKMRFMSAQLLSFLENDLWRSNASQANSNATRITRALKGCDDVEFAHPVDINEIFVSLPQGLSRALADCGINLRPWPMSSGRDGFRLVLSYCDSADDLELFEKTCRDYARDALVSADGNQQSPSIG